MFCAQCGNAFRPGDRFCSLCGAPAVAVAAPEAQTRQAQTPQARDLYATAPRSWKKPALFVGLTLLLLAFLWTGQAFLRRDVPTPTEPVLRAVLPPETPMLQRPAEQAPVLQQPTQQPAQTRMPDDVRAWLEHLERIERQRQEVATRELSGLLVQFVTLQAGATMGKIQGLLGDPLAPEPAPPTHDIRDAGQRIRQQFAALRAEFDRVPAPPQCIHAHASYSQTLGETSVMVNEVLTALEQSAADPQAAVAALTGMRGTSAQRIDAHAREADSRVAEIFAYYNEPKWFSIASDVGGGITSMIPGM